MSIPTTTELTVMTGSEFRKRIEASEYSQRELARRWNVSHTTIQRECEREKVRGLYRDAILRVTEDDG
jgi:IS30 family transposase